MVDFGAGRSLDLVGELVIESEVGQARVEALGDTIRVETTNLRSMVALLEALPKPLHRGRLIRQVQERLMNAGLTLRFEIRSKTVARLGVGAKAGAISKLFGLGPLELRINALLRSFLTPNDRREK